MFARAAQLIGALTTVAAALPGAIMAQTAAPSDKSAMSPALRKIDSQILVELERWRHHQPGPKTGVRIDGDHRAWVDMRAEVTPELREKLRAFGVAIATTSVEYRSIIGWVPLEHLEHIAALIDIHAINPAPAPGIRR